MAGTVFARKPACPGILIRNTTLQTQLFEKVIRLMKSSQNTQALAALPIPKLIARYALPSVTALLVTALYNITDQIFIGRIVGVLGNAATNVAFPLNTLALALAQLCAIGGAAGMNMSLGRGDKAAARRFVATAFTLLTIIAVAFEGTVLLFARPILNAFGATPAVFPYALTYLEITGLSCGFFLFSTGAAFLIRADQAPRYAMICSVSGALLNIVLDALFMIGFGLGIAGAAWATAIGQFLSFILSALYLPKFRSVPFGLGLDGSTARRIAELGLPNFLNLSIMMLANVVMNNVVVRYGAQSVYGSEIPLAVSGIVNKIQSVLIAFVVGIAQGCQPILSYNMGAKNYARVRKTYVTAVSAATVVSLVAFMLFQCFPYQITSLFGSGDPLYYEFSSKFLRVFLSAVFLFGFQPVTVNYFTSIGSVRQGIILSVSRQGLFLIPALILLPMRYGLDGVLYAGPLAETLAFILSVTLVALNFKKLRALQAQNV